MADPLIQTFFSKLGLRKITNGPSASFKELLDLATQVMSFLRSKKG